MSSLSKLDDSIFNIQDSQSAHFHYVMSVTLKGLLAHIICYSPAPPYSELFYAAIKPEKLAAGWGQATLRCALPCLEFLHQLEMLKRPLKMLLTSKQALKKFAAAVDKMDGDPPACEQYEVF